MDPSLNRHPALRRRYEAELRRLGTGCGDCKLATLDRKYQQQLIQAEVAAMKASLPKPVPPR